MLMVGGGSAEAMDEEVIDFDTYEYTEFDGMGNVEDEVLLGESTLAKLREQAERLEVAQQGAQETTGADKEIVGQDEENE